MKNNVIVGLIYALGWVVTPVAQLPLNLILSVLGSIPSKNYNLVLILQITDVYF